MPANALPDQTTCVIAGGGPAGVMLGLLPARAGIDVTVIKKQGSDAAPGPRASRRCTG